MYVGRLTGVSSLALYDFKHRFLREEYAGIFFQEGAILWASNCEKMTTQLAEKAEHI